MADIDNEEEELEVLYDVGDYIYVGGSVESVTEEATDNFYVLKTRNGKLNTSQKLDDLVRSPVNISSTIKREAELLASIEKKDEAINQLQVDLRNVQLSERELNQQVGALRDTIRALRNSAEYNPIVAGEALLYTEYIIPISRMTSAQMNECFGTDGLVSIFSSNTYQELMDKYDHWYRLYHLTISDVVYYTEHIYSDEAPNKLTCIVFNADNENNVYVIFDITNKKFISTNRSHMKLLTDTSLINAYYYIEAIANDANRY